jgi:hypothetical protein
MAFFKKCTPKIKISYRIIILLCLTLQDPTVLRCVFWTNPLLKNLELSWFIHTLFPIPTETITACHMHYKTSGQDLKHGLRSRNRAKPNDHTQGLRLWPRPLCSVCKAVELNESFLSACARQICSRGRFSPLTPKLLQAERIPHFLHSPLLKEESQIHQTEVLLMVTVLQSRRQSYGGDRNSIKH